MNVTIDVTETNLRDGIDCDCHKCPIALALMDVLTPDCKVSVLTNKVYIEHTDNIHKTLPNIHVVALPVEARQFIKHYDGGYDFQPFTFNLEIPDRARPLFKKITIDAENPAR